MSDDTPKPPPPPPEPRPDAPDTSAVENDPRPWKWFAKDKKK